MPWLTIGVIHTGKRKELKATLAALQRDHDLRDTELLIVDTGASKKTRRWVKKHEGLTYLASKPRHMPGALNQLFATATGEAVLCLNGPVRLKNGDLDRLRSYYDAHPDTRDLLHGPLMKGRRLLATHSKPVWRMRDWGVRERDSRGRRLAGEPFTIPMQEPGVLSCLRAAWPGMPTAWRGYGGEAGYIQERFRRAGGRVLCLPGLRWERMGEVRYARPLTDAAELRLRNHLTGGVDLDFDTQYIAHRFRDHAQSGRADEVRLETLRDLEQGRGPLSPLVSCLLYAGRLTPTTVPLLEEAIESFARQDYKHKELVLLNDMPEQTLTCDTPGVRVVNTSLRCPSLGAAFNAAAAFARGEMLAPWGETSINLPWRLTLSVAELGRDEVYRPAGCWYMLDGKLDARPAQPDGGQVALFTRDAFRGVGGYPSTTLGLHREMDAALDAWLTTQGRDRREQSLGQSAWFTILRRTQSDAQYQGDAFLDPWQAQGQLPAELGQIDLNPHWDEDYVAMCAAFLPDRESPDAPPLRLKPLVLGRKGRRGEARLPRINQAKEETAERHLERVVALVEAAVASGASHVVVPRAEASWLAEHPLVAEYLACQHLLLEANENDGFIFALNVEVLSEKYARAGGMASG